jgi:hypothetical protein
MTESISQERWEQAQMGEESFFQPNYESEDVYKNTASIILENYFNINLQTDLVGKKILECGGGCYPASYFCTGLKKVVNVEPLYDKFPDIVKQKLLSKKIESVSIPFEDYTTKIKFDEVWFFNVLQHVRDPIMQIENAKKIAKIIRVFEPINTAINNEHPHSFNLEFFENQFSNTKIEIYKGGTMDKFHQADCVYFVWRSGTK